MSMINQNNTTEIKGSEERAGEGGKKKILIFTTAYLPLVGGAEIAVKEITDRLPQYSFDLITARLKRNLPKEETIGLVEVYRVGFGFWGDKFLLIILGYFLACKLQQKNSYSAIWAIMASYGGLTAVLFKKKYPKVPFLLTLQEGDNLDEIETKTRVLVSLWHDIFKRADHVQCISNYLAIWAKKLGATNISVIPNGVDTLLFTETNQNEDNNYNLVTTSRLVRKNGIDLIIKALPLLPDQVELHIAGVGPEEANLKQLASKLNVSKRVVFHGFIPYKNLPQFLATGRVFIRPSRSEGLGNSFLEAMAVGLPVVGTLVGGIVDFLIDNQTGFVVKDDSPEDIARVVKYILEPSHKPEIETVVREAREQVESKYTWTKVTTDMTKIFNTIV